MAVFIDRERVVRDRTGDQVPWDNIYIEMDIEKLSRVNIYEKLTIKKKIIHDVLRYFYYLYSPVIGLTFFYNIIVFLFKKISHNIKSDINKLSKYIAYLDHECNVYENEIESLEDIYHNLYKDPSVTDLRSAMTEINSQIQKKKGNLGEMEYDRDNYSLLLKQYRKKGELIKEYIDDIIQGGYGNFFSNIKKFIKIVIHEHDIRSYIENNILLHHNIYGMDRDKTADDKMTILLEYLQSHRTNDKVFLKDYVNNILSTPEFLENIYYNLSLDGYDKLY